MQVFPSFRVLLLIFLPSSILYTSPLLSFFSFYCPFFYFFSFPFPVSQGPYIWQISYKFPFLISEVTGRKTLMFLHDRCERLSSDFNYRQFSSLFDRTLCITSHLYHSPRFLQSPLPLSVCLSPPFCHALSVTYFCFFINSFILHFELSFYFDILKT